MESAMMTLNLLWPSPTKERTMPEPIVIGWSLLGLALCVPSDWTEEQCLEFGEQEQPAGTSAGYYIMDEKTLGAKQRRRCMDREGAVHVVLGV